MYIFDKPYEYFEHPWPHIVIKPFLPKQFADYMRDNFPLPGPSKKEQQHNRWAGDYWDDKVFAEFSRVNENRQDDIYTFLDKAFNDAGDVYGWTPFQYRNEPAVENPIELRDYHVDLPDKKYHIMMYLGEGDRGELEMINYNTGQHKSFPYEHNRLIAWRNDDFTHHKWWSSTSRRFTISLGIEYYENALKNLWLYEDNVTKKQYYRAHRTETKARNYANEVNATIIREPYKK